MSEEFAEYIKQSREKLTVRKHSLRLEIAELDAELAAIAAYEAARAPALQKPRRGRPRVYTSRRPHEVPVDPTAETMSVKEAGRRFLGLSESGSWLAWRRGDIPSFKQGRYRRVPVDAMRKRLEERPARSRVREEEGYPGSLVPAQ